MKALLLTLIVLTCSAESCQKDHPIESAATPRMHKAPEIDPGSMVAAITLLVGALLVIRGKSK